MTVDNSQIAGRDVIILQASTVAPAVLITSPPYSSERGQASKPDGDAPNKVSQHDQFQQAQAFDRQQGQRQQQRKQQRQRSPRKNNECQVSASSSSTDTNNIINEDNKNADVPPQPVAPAPAVAVPSVESVDRQQRQHQQQQQQAATTTPKCVRVGEKVCFSTVVAAVLIPSSRDLNAADKRELWWQPTDYSDFRINYATHMLNPSIELEEQEGTGPAPTVPVASNADAPATAATATVEGVLVVAASPAPAPLTSRQVNVNQTTARRGGGGGDVAPSQDRMPKSFRHEKNARSRASVGNTHEQQQQHKNVSGRRRMVSGPGYPGPPPPPPHHASYMRQQQFQVQPQQQQQQPILMVRGHHGQGHAVAGLGRRDARHDPYLAPRGIGNMNNHGGNHLHHRQAHHHGMSAASSGRNGQQFFVNGNPAGVNCPPSQQQARMATAAAPPAFRGGNANRPVAKAYLPHPAAGEMRNGVAMAPTGTSFASRGGWAAGMAPYHSSAVPNAVGGGGNAPVPLQMAGSPSQFSMWRSQLVFAPVMQMQ